MPRKKILDGDSETTAAVDLGSLDHDEEIVARTTTEKRYSKERRKDAGPEPDKPTGKIIDVDNNGDAIEGEDDPVFEQGTLGALLTRDEDDELRNTQCNVIVVRKPDTPGEKFAKPCVSRMVEPPIRNVELTTPQTDIEEMVRTNYLGGHYYLQIQIGNQLQTGWSCDLADPLDAHARLRAQERGEELPAPVVVAAAAAQQQPGDFLDDFIVRSKKMKDLKEAIFGEELAELTRLRAAVPAEPQTAEMMLLKKAFEADANPNLQTKLLDMAFPADKKDSRSTTAEIFDLVLENGDKILPVVQGVLGMLFGSGQTVQQPTNGGGAIANAAPPPNTAVDPMAAFRQPAPVDVPPPRASRMRQNMTPPVETSEAETPVIDSEIGPRPATLEPVVE